MAAEEGGLERTVGGEPEDVHGPVLAQPVDPRHRLRFKTALLLEAQPGGDGDGGDRQGEANALGGKGEVGFLSW